MKILLLLAFLPLLLFSCKAPRDGTTVVEGQVVDRHTGAGIADATVSVMKSNANSSNATYSHVKDIQAGSDGRFSFSFEGDGSFSYILMATTEIGHYTLWQEAPEITSGRKNKEIKVKAQAPAWVRVKLVDEPPLGVVRLDIWGFKDDFYGPIYPKADTSFFKLLDGGIAKSIHYMINPISGDDPINHIPVSPAALDTITIIINF